MEKIIRISRKNLKVNPNAKGKEGLHYITVNTEARLVSLFGLKELTAIYNGYSETKHKGFGSKKLAAKRIFNTVPEDLLVNPNDGEAKVAKKQKKVTKVSILRECLAKGKYNKDQLMKETGFDKRNLGTALTILKNPNRTKPPLDIKVNDKGIYSC